MNGPATTRHRGTATGCSYRVLELRRLSRQDSALLGDLSVREECVRQALMPTFESQRGLVREVGLDGATGCLEGHFHAFDSALLESGWAVSLCPVCGRAVRSRESYPVKDTCHFIIFYRFECHGDFFILKGSPSTVGMYLPAHELVLRYVDEDESFGQMFFRPEQLAADIDHFKALTVHCREDMQSYALQPEKRALHILTGHFQPIGHHLVNELPGIERLIECGLGSRLAHVAEPLYHYFDLNALFPEIGRVHDWSRGRMDFRAHAVHVFQCALKGNAFVAHPYHVGKIQNALDRRFLDYTRTRLRPDVTQVIHQDKGFWPRLWVTLRSGNRSWKSQNDGLVEVLNGLHPRYPGMQVIFDGLPKETSDREAIVSRLHPEIRWVNALNCTREETIYWTHFIDCHLSPVGNGGVFISLANKPGVYHGSSRILKHYCTGADGAEGFSLHPREGAVNNYPVTSLKDFTPEQDMHFCDYEADPADMIAKLDRVLKDNRPARRVCSNAAARAPERNMDMPTMQDHSQAAQRQLLHHYRFLSQAGMPLPHFTDAGFRIFSQNDEDGLLLYIFALIGFANRVLVDIAFGSPLGSNSTNLLCNWGFYGLLVEGDPAGIEASREFFASHPDTAFLPPALQRAWVTAENINPILEHHGLTGEIDLFCLDVDGVDYWLWKALTAVRPRVVIAEAAAYLGREHALTVPYRPDFNRLDVDEWFCGASIPAFIRLGREKGYRLVACNRYGFNLIFLREDLGGGALPEISAGDCFHFEPAALRQRRLARRHSVMRFNWVEV